jgi:hypothetical protein
LIVVCAVAVPATAKQSKRRAASSRITGHNGCGILRTTKKPTADRKIGFDKLRTEITERPGFEPGVRVYPVRRFSKFFCLIVNFNEHKGLQFARKFSCMFSCGSNPDFPSKSVQNNEILIVYHLPELDKDDQPRHRPEA